MTPTPQFDASPAGPTPTQDERTWALVAHLSGLIAFFVGALVVLLAKGSESPWVRAQAAEALNFQLTVAAATVATFVLTFVGSLLLPFASILGFCLIPGLGLAALVFTIIAAVKCYGGESYRYPINVRLVK